MSVGLLIVTHGDIGHSVYDSAVRMLGVAPLRAEVLSAASDESPEHLLRRAREALARVDQGDGVLVFTDIYGGTPSNVARSLCDGERVCMISGLNLPMLVRVLNYPHLDLAALSNKAISGGRDGIFFSRAEEHA